MGIVSNVGGPGILAADACEGHGLSVPALSASLAAALRAAVPTIAGASNPVDVGAGGGPGDLALAGRLLAESGEIDALIVAAAPLRGAPPRRSAPPSRRSPTPGSPSPAARAARRCPRGAGRTSGPSRG